MAKSKYADEYRKQRRRIQNFLRRARQRGFDFPKFKLPDIPKKITKASVERLKKITPKKLYEQGTYKTLSGDTVSAKQGQALRKQLAKERRQRKKITQRIEDELNRRFKSQEFPEINDVIIQNTYKELDRFTPEYNWTSSLIEDKRQKIDIIRRMIEGAIRREGKAEVARRLNDSAELWNKSLDSVLYGSGSAYRDNANDALNTLAYILNGENLNREQKMSLADIESYDDEEY